MTVQRSVARPLFRSERWWAFLAAQALARWDWTARAVVLALTATFCVAAVTVAAGVAIAMVTTSAGVFGTLVLVAAAARLRRQRG